jgi:ribose transport system ATP-binding protein
MGGLPSARRLVSKGNELDTDLILKASRVSKSFFGVHALKSVDFELRRGEIHALVGENGAGKSTLMNILAGIYPMDSGELFVGGKKREFRDHRTSQKCGISIVFQERSLLNNLTVTENIFGGLPPKSGVFGAIDWKKSSRKAKEYLDKIQLKVDMDAFVGELSTATQQMIEIAKAMSNEFEILILDEPTATITVDETKVIFELLKNLKRMGKSIIYISHRLKEIKEIADRATVLKDGEYIGTYDVNKISLEFLVSKMVGRDISDERIIDRSLSGEVILETRKLCGKGFHDIDLKLRKGEILTLTGLSGAGRTELARALFGESPATTGEILFEGKTVRIRSPGNAMALGLGYVSEDRKDLGLFLDMTVMENILAPNLKKFSRGMLVNGKQVEATAAEYCKRLDVKVQSIEQRASNLSGGNQQKICLAKWIIFNPKILIIDEPTKGVDVGAKFSIYGILRNLAHTGIGIIVISSDMVETLSLGTRIVVMSEGRMTGELERVKATEEQILMLASS